MTFKPAYLKAIFLFLLFVAGFTGFANFAFNIISNGWDQKTEEHLDELLINAGTAYGVSRGLNAVISIIQESDVNIVIGNLALGEALDPVNDIVERFSNVMLLSITSISVQKFIYGMGKIYGVNLFFTLAILFLLTAAVFESLPYLNGEKVIVISNTLGTSFLVIFLLIRFIIPTIVLLSLETENIFDTDISETIVKLDEIKTNSQLEYNDLSEEMNPIEEIAEEDKNIFSRISDSVRDAGRKISDTFNATRIKENMNRVIDSLQESIQYITDLIVIFIIQTIIIPILTLFLLKASFQPLITLFLTGFNKEKSQEHIYSAP